MVEKKSVNVNWQSLFVLIPIIDLWAAYRIEKFRLYFVIFWIVSFTVQEVATYSMLGEKYWIDWGRFLSADPSVAYVELAMMIVAYGIAIYFIRLWSKEWNDKVTS